jgi:hypothetical protein
MTLGRKEFINMADCLTIFLTVSSAVHAWVLLYGMSAVGGIYQRY